MTHDLDHDLRTLTPSRRGTNGLSDRALDDRYRMLAGPRGGVPVGTPVRPRGPLGPWGRRLVRTVGGLVAGAVHRR